MSGLRKAVGWALVLLALAYPHTAVHAVALLLGHLSAVCVVGAVLLLIGAPLRLYLRRRRWAHRLRRVLRGAA